MTRVSVREEKRIEIVEFCSIKLGDFFVPEEDRGRDILYRKTFIIFIQGKIDKKFNAEEMDTGRLEWFDSSKPVKAIENVNITFN